MAKAQQELQFAEVTPIIPSNGSGQIALSIHAGGIAADIHNGADPATVEAVLPYLKAMLNDFNCSCPVYIACGYTDLRRGIDGLAGIVSTQFQMDPFQTALFLFCGRQTGPY